VTSRFIGEPLTLHALQGNVGTAHVINADLLSVGVSEIKLRQITVQMGLADIVINARDAALKDRKIPFNGVAVSVAAHIFELAIIDHFIAGERLTDLHVTASGIGHEGRFETGVFAQDRPEIGAADARDYVRTHAPVTLDKRMNDHFAHAADVSGVGL